MRKAVTLVCSVFALALVVAACDAPENGAEPMEEEPMEEEPMEEEEQF